MPDALPEHHPRDLTPAQLSHGISLSRFVLVMGLVFLHYGNLPGTDVAPLVGIDTQHHPLATGINSAIAFFFFSAVPLMSMISGWLFFSFDPAKAGAALKRCIRRRFLSLYLPLVVWNAAYLAMLYAAYATHPASSFFTHTSRISINFPEAGWFDYLNAVFAITKEPVAFQFWFVRDLFLTVLISPVLWWMLRRAPRAGGAVLCIIWLSGMRPGIFIRGDVPFFFYLGGLVHVRRLPVTVPLKTTVLLAVLYASLATLRALAPYVAVFDRHDAGPFWLETMTRGMRIVGVIACWGLLYRAAQTRWGRVIGGFGGVAFFLHSAHWPLLALVKVAVLHLIPAATDAGMLAHYVASVLVTIAAGLGLGMALAKAAPRIFALMNGGRFLEQSMDREKAIQPEPGRQPQS